MEALTTSTARTARTRVALLVSAALATAAVALPAGALADTGGVGFDEPTATQTGGATPTAAVKKAAPRKKPSKTARKKAVKRRGKLTAGGASATAIKAAEASYALGDRIPLRGGQQGADVVALQKLLATVGHDVGDDGDFGPRTTKGLKAWETSAHRPVNGVLGASDLTALRAASASATAPAAGTTPPPGTAPAPLAATTTASTAPPASPATATITPDGLATAPASAPDAVKAMIAAANRIATLPYRYGGGHKSFDDTAYDCSGSVSYALHGASLLDTTLDSTMLESYGAAGTGTWVTIYANADHTFMVVAGIRFDTSGQKQAGTRWQPAAARSYAGFVVRHPAGL